MNWMDSFWAAVDAQIKALRSARSAADVVRICPPGAPGTSSGDGFFHGGGGDVLPDEPLLAAGWSYAWVEAPYFWAMRSPAGDFVEYVEGDIYVHDSPPPEPNSDYPLPARRRTWRGPVTTRRVRGRPGLPPLPQPRPGLKSWSTRKQNT